MNATRADDLRQRIVRVVESQSAVSDDACVVRVELPDQGVVVRHAAGGIVRGQARAHPLSSFRIASITKPFTAAVVMQLVAEGRLGLDDAMIDHLPADLHDVVDRVHVIDGVSYGRRITVRQMLTHASGLFDFAQSAGFFTAIAADPGRHWSPREMLEGAGVWGAAHFPPGEGYGYAYSDTGYVFLGCIIEGLDAGPLHESYRRRIIGPLGLAATYLEGYEEHRGEPMIHPHQGDLDASVIDGSADWAGGGLVSDTDDLAVFARALIDGTLVPQPLLDEMLDYRFRTLDPDLHTPGYVGYGCGVDARESSGLVLRGHRGYWGALMHIDPVSGLTITGTISQAERRPDELMHAVVAAARDTFPESFEVPA
ncbi:MAG: hypothetical protein RI958_2478 [Actinomycetota bacterium]|jgi:D-alanyl-D-alanine carboxypeptidase